MSQGGRGITIPRPEQALWPVPASAHDRKGLFDDQIRSRDLFFELGKIFNHGIQLMLLRFM